MLENNDINKINYQNVNFAKIKESSIGIGNLLENIKKDNDKDNLRLFIICLYNFERWFI